MKIGLHNFPVDGLNLQLEEAPENFEALSEMMKNGECQFKLPIKIDLAIESVRDMFQVNGSFNTTVKLSCSRCLVEYETTLKENFFLVYVKQIPGLEDLKENSEIELKAQDMGYILFQGDEIDLKEGIQEQVVLSLPLKPLCKENCKGLCSNCAIDLNTNSCACHEIPQNSPFAALAKLSSKKK